ncbi:hypothetical protein Y032_0453g1719 [Ancylostoma ceylanicum]|nr:hypothetical protein Y032_0453g1719 [Ancylostoma ceylanicum]
MCLAIHFMGERLKILLGNAGCKRICCSHLTDEIVRAKLMIPSETVNTFATMCSTGRARMVRSVGLRAQPGEHALFTVL